MVHFTSVKLTVWLTVQDIISNAARRRHRAKSSFTRMRWIVSELASCLADINELGELEVSMNIHFDMELYEGLEEALGVNVRSLLQYAHMNELIGRSARWLMSPFYRIHNLTGAKFNVDITGVLFPSLCHIDRRYTDCDTGLTNPPEIIWNDGLVRFLDTIIKETMSRRSSRVRGSSSVRLEDAVFEIDYPWP